MSAAATSWARGSGIRGSAQAVLAALAGFHNAKTGECRPGLNAICTASGLTRPTVCRALDTLREAGLVSWTKGADARGQRATNVYELHGVKDKPRVKLCNSGGEKPRVKYSDVGFAIPELSSVTRLKRDKGGAPQPEKNEARAATVARSVPCRVSDGKGGKVLGNKAPVETPRPATRQPAPAASVGETPATVSTIPSTLATPAASARLASEANKKKEQDEMYPSCASMMAPPLAGAGGASSLLSSPQLARPVFPAPRHPTPAQIDAAVRDAWRAFEDADDPHNPEAWLQ